MFPKGKPNSKRIDLAGRRFVRWTVLALSPTFVVGAGAVLWRCRCACGTESDVTAGNLLSGKSRSCGCLAAEEARVRFSLPKGEAALNALCSKYRASARKRGHAWHLDKAAAHALFVAACKYCGAPPSQTLTTSEGGGVFMYNGIDRVDAARGYTVSNCVSCCKTCNTAKMKMTRDEFLTWVVRVFNYLVAPQAA